MTPASEVKLTYGALSDAVRALAGLTGLLPVLVLIGSERYHEGKHAQNCLQFAQL